MKYSLLSSLLFIFCVHMLLARERIKNPEEITPVKQSKTPAVHITTPKQTSRHPIRPPRIKWHVRGTFISDTDQRLVPHNFTTSVIIPCYYKHAPFLYQLLVQYAQQTVLPDEVVISLSEHDRVSDDVMTQLTQARWPFPVTLVLVTDKQYAGDNRNTACDHARGDVFICQDADDLAHPQRVEIIRYFFDQYPVEHLFHEWIDIPTQAIYQFPKYDEPEKIFFTYHKAFQELWQYAHLTNGNVALARHVFDKVRWSSAQRGQDTLFNKAVYEQFKYGIAIRAELLGYRQFLSSTQPIDENIYVHNTEIHTAKEYSQVHHAKVIYVSDPEASQVVQ